MRQFSHDPQLTSPPALMIFDSLGLLSFFPILKVFMSLGSIRIYHINATGFGLILIRILRIFGIVGDCVRIEDFYGLDTQHSKFDECHFRALRISQAAHKKVECAVVKFFSGMSKYSEALLRAGVQNTWAGCLATLFQLQVFAEQKAKESNTPLEQVVVVSVYANLYSNLKSDSPSLFLPSSISIIQQPFRNRMIAWLLRGLYWSLRGVAYQLFDYWFGGARELKVKKYLPRIAFSAVSGIRGKGEPPALMDDLKWWKGSGIPGERLIYFYDRPNFQPTEKKVRVTDSMGVRSFVWDRRYPGDFPSLIIDKFLQKSFWISLMEIFQVFTRSIRVLFVDELAQSVLALGTVHMVAASRLASYFRELNIKGIIHYQQVDADWHSLAAEFNDACRFGISKSSVHPIAAFNYATPQVFFSWGMHEANVLIDSGCTSKYLLIAGCFVDKTQEDHDEAQKRFLILVEKIRSCGANYLLALFDTSILMREFYSFFLDWLIKDPKLGLIVKGKGQTWLKVEADGLDGLVQKALATGRLQIADAEASPADIVSLVDFSIGIASYSAVVVSALKGARVLYIDLQRVDQGPCDKSHLCLQSLGPNRCVFYDFDSAKRAILGYFNDPESNPNLGDVSPVLDLFDPFRDGLAGQRIGEYMKWYMDGLDKGLNRDDSLLHATRKYASKWGEDKVVRGLSEPE
jgi:hypothetical protein